MAINVTYSPIGAVGRAAHASGKGARQRADQLERVRQQEVAAARQQQMDLAVMQLTASRDAQTRAAQFGAEADARRFQQDKQMLGMRGELDAQARADQEARGRRNLDHQFGLNVKLGNIAEDRRAAEIERIAFNDLLIAENEAADAAQAAEDEKLARNARYVNDYNFIAGQEWSDDKKAYALDALREKYLGIKELPKGPTFKEQVEQDIIHNEDGSMFIPDGVKYTPPPKSAAQMVTSQQDFGKMWTDARKALTYKDESTGKMVVPTADDIRAEVKAMQDEYRAMVKAYEDKDEDEELTRKLRGTIQQLRDDSAGANSQEETAQQQAEAEAMQEMQRFETFTTEIYAALQDPNRYAFAGTHQEAARRTVAQATAILKSPDATPEQRAKAMEILNDAALATGVKY